METTAKVIAVSGKGGVGKTTLAAAMVRHLTECKPDARILAIDADPAVGLSTCLGIEVTLTLDERPGEEEINEAEQQAQAELEGQSQQDEEFGIPGFDEFGDFGGYGYDYGG